MFPLYTRQGLIPEDIIRTGTIILTGTETPADITVRRELTARLEDTGIITLSTLTVCLIHNINTVIKQAHSPLMY